MRIFTQRTLVGILALLLVTATRLADAQGTTQIFLATDNHIDLYNVANGTAAFQRTLITEEADSTIYAVHFGSDGALYTTDSTVDDQGNEIDNIRRYNADTGALLNTVYAPSNMFVTDFTFGADGNLYVADAGGVEKVNPANGALLQAFSDAFFSLARCAPDGNIQLGGGQQSYTLQTLNVSTGGVADFPAGSAPTVAAIAVGMDGRVFASKTFPQGEEGIYAYNADGSNPTLLTNQVTYAQALALNGSTLYGSAFSTGASDLNGIFQLDTISGALTSLLPNTTGFGIAVRVTPVPELSTMAGMALMGVAGTVSLLRRRRIGSRQVSR